MNWLLDQQMVNDHLDAIHRASSTGVPAWEREPRRPGRVRRAIGVKLVGMGLASAAGLRAAREASTVVCEARDALAAEGS
ncbi:MAG: hypothetical protein ACXVQY_00260 [Actinomycetota bacterium]